MFTYQLSTVLHTIDYYTDEYSSCAAINYNFSHINVWVARRNLRLFLLFKQNDTSIVRFYEIEIRLSYTVDNQVINLGTWFLSNYPQREHYYLWNWEKEIDFLTKNQLLKTEYKELLLIEQKFYENYYHRKNNQTSPIHLLDDFVVKYQANLLELSVELGLLYSLIGNHEKCFEYLSATALPELQRIMYKTAFYLAHLAPKPNYTYIRKYEELYPNPLPFLE